MTRSTQTTNILPSSFIVMARQASEVSDEFALLKLVNDGSGAISSFPSIMSMPWLTVATNIRPRTSAVTSMTALLHRLSFLSPSRVSRRNVVRRMSRRSIRPTTSPFVVAQTRFPSEVMSRRLTLSCSTSASPPLKPTVSGLADDGSGTHWIPPPNEANHRRPSRSSTM